MYDDVGSKVLFISHYRCARRWWKANGEKLCEIFSPIHSANIISCSGRRDFALRLSVRCLLLVVSKRSTSFGGGEQKEFGNKAQKAYAHYMMIRQSNIIKWVINWIIRNSLLSQRGLLGHVPVLLEMIHWRSFQPICAITSNQPLTAIVSFTWRRNRSLKLREHL